MKRKLLFVDLDGTLLNDAKQITTGNQQALEQLLARGHSVIIATGRPLRSAIKQAHTLGLDQPGCFLIAYNGALIYDCTTKQPIFSETLSHENVMRIFDYANTQGVHIQTYDDDDVLVEPCCDDDAVRRYCALIEMNYRVISDIHIDLEKPPVKCLAIDFKEQTKLLQIQHWIQEQMSSEIDCFFSCPYYLEIVPRGINKGKAVHMLSHLMQVPIAHTVAVGDAANDIPMIEAAGVGVAMANASNAVKEASDDITKNDNNHDGIAQVIARYFDVLSE